MRIGVIGINHKSAEIQLREDIAKICERCFIKEKRMDDSLVILSTCNRTELYFSSDDLPETHSTLLNILRQEFALPFEHRIYSYFGKDCFLHLATVTSGLDSAIIGESEIQGQVKKAYELALSQRSLSSDMHFLFQKSLKIGKALRTSSLFTHMMPTIEDAIFQAATHLLNPLFQKKILLIGYSEINAKIFKSFNKRNLNLTFCNRTSEKLLHESVKVLNWEEFFRWQEFDMIIFGTKSPHYLLTPEQVSSLSHKKLLIDLSVPRNVDPRLAKHPFIKLLNLDQLMKGFDRKRKIRAEELARQEKSHIEEKVDLQISLFEARSSYIPPLLEVV